MEQLCVWFQNPDGVGFELGEIVGGEGESAVRRDCLGGEIDNKGMAPAW